MEKSTLISQNIRRIVTDRGIKFSWVAKKIGVSRQKLCDILRGRKTLTEECADQIAKLLDVSVDELLKEE